MPHGAPDAEKSPPVYHPERRRAKKTRRVYRFLPVAAAQNGTRDRFSRPTTPADGTQDRFSRHLGAQSGPETPRRQTRRVIVRAT